MSCKLTLAVVLLSLAVGRWTVADESDTPIRVAPEITPYSDPSATREATNLPDDLNASKELEELKSLVLNDELPREHRHTVLNLLIKVERMQTALELATRVPTVPLGYHAPPSNMQAWGFIPPPANSVQPGPLRPADPNLPQKQPKKAERTKKGEADLFSE